MTFKAILKCPALWVLCFFLSGCSLEKFFYYPNRVLYNDPDVLKLDYELVHYPSLNGKTLYALFFKSAVKPKGTIVHFHGNYGNMTNHFPLGLFLLKEGFDVLIFDYQGYGGSQGSPNRKKTIEDGLATVRYAQEHLRDPRTGVGLLGQSLGGAVGVVVMAQEPLVRGAVIEAAFTSYRGMTRTVLKRHWFTYPFSWVLPPFLGRRWDPLECVAQIKPRPLLFIHGEADRIVPPEMSKILFEAAREPKTLWMIPGADHLQCHRRAGGEYERTVAEFFRKAIQSPAYIDQNKESNASL